MAMNDNQIERYSRHVLVPEIGGRGQERLLAGKVLIVGTGGLGSPSGLYLAAAGVGVIGVMDHDRVELSNLQRQVIHSTPDLGQPKVSSAAAKMRALNPDVDVRTYSKRLTAENALQILPDYDFVIDGTDSFASKFLIADACHFAGKPYSHAGILQFVGQAITVVPGSSACYRCLFGAPPPPGAVPSCSQAGVLGVVAGMVGVLQATEAIKFLLGVGTLLTDSLLIYDALDMGFRKVKVRRNPRCPLCGETPRITELTEDQTAAVCTDRACGSGPSTGDGEGCPS